MMKKKYNFDPKKRTVTEYPTVVVNCETSISLIASLDEGLSLHVIDDRGQGAAVEFPTSFEISKFSKFLQESLHMLQEMTEASRR